MVGTRGRYRLRSLTFIAAMSVEPDAGMGEDFFGALEVDEADRVGALVQAMGETTWATSLGRCDWLAIVEAIVSRDTAVEKDQAPT